MPLAKRANGHVFDLAEPTAEEVEAFWADVETARRRLRSHQGLWQKLRGDVSLSTFRDQLPTGAGLGPALARTSRRQGKAQQPGRRDRSRATASARNSRATGARTTSATAAATKDDS